MAHKCPDYIKELNDYLDGTLDSSVCQEIDAHIGECENCRIMIDTLKQTVKLCQGGKEVTLPVDLEAKLNNILKARWDKKFGQKQ
jgi:predicted anti-sigma-YlaC factor YlaD